MKARRTYVTLIGAGVVLAAPAWAYTLFFVDRSGYLRGLVYIPLLCLLSLALITRAARGAPRLKLIMLVGLGCKLAAAGLYLAYFEKWGGGADALGYFDMGKRIANDLLVASYWPALDVGQASGTQVIHQVTALLIVVLGPSLSTLSVIYATLAYWSCYLYYRAFRLVLPKGDHELFAVLVFLFPSNVLWTAAIGKDAVIAFSLGLAFFGAARLTQRADLSGAALFCLGIGGVLVIRPHVALMAVMSFLLAYAVGRARGGFAGTLLKFVAVPLVFVLSFYALYRAQEFLGAYDLDAGTRKYESVQRNTNAGGSAANIGFAYAPALFFRPLPWEIRNAGMAVSSAEAMFLLALVIARRRSLVSTIRRHGRSPLVLSSWLLLIGFSIVFSGAIANLGILVRQRVMVLPLLLMLLCSEVEVRRPREAVLRASLRPRLPELASTHE